MAKYNGTLIVLVAVMITFAATGIVVLPMNSNTCQCDKRGRTELFRGEEEVVP
ncbi:MAG: hypothetical protein ACRD8W_07865 [Nitrososphaeraceae archaeon]